MAAGRTAWPAPRLTRRRFQTDRAFKGACYDQQRDGSEPACAILRPTTLIMSGDVEDLKAIKPEERVATPAALGATTPKFVYGRWDQRHRRQPFQPILADRPDSQPRRAACLRQDKRRSASAVASPSPAAVPTAVAAMFRD